MIAVIPAAGIGQRMGAALPKQYLQCSGSTLLDHTIKALLQEARVRKVYVALSADDSWFNTSAYAKAINVERVTGGDTRASSVLNALSEAMKTLSPTTLVAVHDAARPCLPPSLFSRLLDVAEKYPMQGALLALPVRDTVKCVSASNKGAAADNTEFPVVTKTVNREELWLAQTPQVFRLGDLHRALTMAAEQGLNITDEASAMEAQGTQPVLVSGSRMVMKVTDPEDLALIDFYLKELKA